MVRPILMPKPGQMTEECVLVAWHKREGDPVRRGDVLFEIETDKSVMDVEAFDDGVLLRRLVEEGETVPVNSVCAYVGAAGEEIPEQAPRPAAGAAAAGGPVSGESAERSAAAPVSPAVAASAPPPDAAPAPADVSGAAPREGRRGVSPRAARLAAASGIDPRSIAGTGPGGRIVERDVVAALAAAASRSGPAPAAPAPVPPVDGEEAPQPLSPMRRVIARRLTESVTTIPHFTVTVAVDVTRLLALREDLKAAGRPLTVTDLILHATARTLAEMSEVNSRTDGTSVWMRPRVHLGLAVSVPAGLVVPVIRDADRLSVDAIHDRAAALAAEAREGRLSRDDMTGGTFTVSNLGMHGVEEFSAIINPGESAILAVASAVRTPVVVGEGIAIRSIMKLTLSADHRLVDGELAARFLGALRRRLEDAPGILRDVEAE